MPFNSPRIPTYRRHSSGQARVTLNGKDYLLGPYGSPESQEAYRRLVAEWLESHQRVPVEPVEQAANPLTINELILAYWKFAESYYGFQEGRGDAYCLRDALRIVRSLYGTTAAKDFGPLALKACRKQMIDKDWSRGYVNSQVDRVRRMFRWAAEEELLPGSVYQNLRTVTSLRKGKSAARESRRVPPVPDEHLHAALPCMPPTVRAMVELQLLAGCRPDEVCRMRPLDIDMTNPKCWVYRPGSDQGQHGEHKTAHHGHERMILLGPKAQEVLRPFLGGKPDTYCFSPIEGEVRRNANRRALRISPMTPSQRRRRPKARRHRAPRDHYDTHSYRRAIQRACDKAGVPAWGPNRLRHNRATELRRQYGLDLAKTILGHSKIETTLIYAEKDIQAAMDVVSQVG